MITLDKILYTAKAHTTGGRDGGSSRTDDGRLEVKLSDPGRSGTGTNAEQLFAAGWSACFLAAIRIVAAKRKVALPSEVTVDTEIDLGRAGDGHGLAGRLNINLGGMDQDAAESLVEAASNICPYSLAIKGNIDVKYKRDHIRRFGSRRSNTTCPRESLAIAADSRPTIAIPFVSRRLDALAVAGQFESVCEPSHFITASGQKKGSRRPMSTTLTTPQTITTWTLDPVHSVAEFKVKHMMISNVKGQFTGITGVLILDENEIAGSRIEATIDASTINTREAQRDAHLKSADFFDVEQFPTLSFRSTQVKRTGDDELAVTGDLTIHGVTRQVTFQVEGPTAAGKDPWGNTRIGLSATTKINRKDFGLTWNTALETGGILVGEDITITLDAEFVKA